MKTKKKKSGSTEPKISVSKTLSASTYATWLPPFILATITYLFYRPSLSYSFQFDDIANIRKFFAIRHETFSSLFFTSARWISYWLNTVHFQLDRFEPYVYRRTNLCMHTTTGIMLFFVMLFSLERTEDDSFFKRNRFIIAFLTAGLFLLHPVQTQTVSYVIQGQLEGMATFFTVAMSLCFLLMHRTQNSVTKMIATTLLFVSAFLATGTKEIAIVAPFMILLLDWFFVARGNTNSMKTRIWIHLSLFTIVWGMYLYFLKPSFFIKMFGLQIEARNNIGNILTENQSEKIYPLHFLISQFKVIVHYIWMFIWPFNISVEYDWKLSRSFFSIDSLFPFLALVMLATIVGYLLRKNRTNLFAFGALWFAIAVAPRSSIIPSSELLNDYKTYMASIGILFILACALTKAWEIVRDARSSQTPLLEDIRLQYALMSLLIVPVGAATYSRNKVWRSPSEFWFNIIQNAPGKARAYNNYAVALCEQNKYREAVPYYRTAIKMDNKYPDPINNLAVAYSVLGYTDEAIQVLQQSIRLQPGHPEGHNNLASFYIQKKEYEKAETALNNALKLRPYYGKAHFNYGKLCSAQGRNEEAFTHFKKACTECDLDDQTGYSVYGQVSMRLHKYEDAIAAYGHLRKMDPNNLEYAIELATAYQAHGDAQQAGNLFQQLAQHSSKDSRVAYGLGEMHYKQGQIQQALAYYTQAKALRYPQPTLYIRMADCLQRLGKVQDARVLLTQVSQMDNVPEQYKAAAQAGLQALAA